MSSSKITRKRSPHDFIFKQELGHGSYSTVYKAIDRYNVNHVYAIKVCSKAHIIKEKKVKYVTIEKNTLNLLARTGHPGVVRLYFTFHDEENLYFVLDYAAGGELLQLLHKMGKFSESWSLHFTCQLIDSIEFIHSKGIIHRDLKPENLLLSNLGKLMITDFGTATTPLDEEEHDRNSVRCSSFVGTAEYVSPELLLSNKCDFASDVWALGCIIFQFIMGTPPFRGQNELQTFEKIASLDYVWNNPHYSSNKISPAIIKLVQNILVINPVERLTLANMKKDVWFEKVDWNDKDLIWRGIWQIPESTNGFPQRQNLMSNKPLHVIDTPIRSIPITKQKKKKPTKVSTTTSSIVEWRKRLGISQPTAQISVSTNGSKIRGQPNILPQFDTVKQPQRTLKSPHSISSAASIPRPVKRSVSQPLLSVDTSEKHLYRPVSASNDSHSHPSPTAVANPPHTSSIVLKQGYVNIFEIPFLETGPQMSLQSYSKIDNELITELVSKHRDDLKSSSSLPTLLTLFKDGTLSYKNNGFSKHIVNVGDHDLSMYDFEFYEQKCDGFLILEKFRYMIWFISLSFVTPSAQIGPIKNEKENWVDCFFRARQILEENTVVDKLKNVKLDEPFMPVPSPIATPPIGSPVNEKSKDTVKMKKTQQSIPTSRRSNLSERRQISSSPSLEVYTRRNGPKSSPPPLSPPVSSPVIPIYAKKAGYRSPSSPMASNPSSMKKYAAPNNMVISSSRYELLNALKQNTGTSVASSGASAAFKNLQKKANSNK